MHETLKHLLETEPVIGTFDVQSGTPHPRITARKAARGKVPEKGALKALFVFPGKAILDAKNFV